MTGLAVQRCFNHAEREAAARCTGCGQCFCRECIAEHDDRVLCAACLRKVVEKAPSSRRQFTPMLRVVQCALGVLAVWFFFYFLGESLLSLPTAFHEGTLWKIPWIDQE